jgi:hypothetical protein
LEEDHGIMHTLEWKLAEFQVVSYQTHITNKRFERYDRNKNLHKPGHLNPHRHSFFIGDYCKNIISWLTIF